MWISLKLSEAMQYYMYGEIYIVPALLINGYMYRGEMNPFLATTSICQSFSERPNDCEDLRHRMHTHVNDTAL